MEYKLKTKLPADNCSENMEVKDRNLEFLNSLAIKLADLPSDISLSEFLPGELKKFTGATISLYSDYDEHKRALIIRHIEASSWLLNYMIEVMGNNITNVVSPVSDHIYQEIIKETVGLRNSFAEISFGAIPEIADKALRAFTGITHLYGIALVVEGRLFGTLVLAFKDNQIEPSIEMLKSFAHLAAVSLRRKQAEDKLKQSEIHYRTLFDNAAIGIYRISHDGNILMINQALYRIFGYLPGEGTKSLENILFHNEHKHSAFNNQLQNRNHICIESKYERSDGQVIFARENITAVRDNSGNILYYDGTIEDISDRKKEEELGVFVRDLYAHLNSMTDLTEAMAYLLESF